MAKLDLHKSRADVALSSRVESPSLGISANDGCEEQAKLTQLFIVTSSRCYSPTPGVPLERAFKDTLSPHSSPSFFKPKVSVYFFSTWKLSSRGPHRVCPAEVLIILSPLSQSCTILRTLHSSLAIGSVLVNPWVSSCPSCLHVAISIVESLVR